MNNKFQNFSKIIVVFLLITNSLFAQVDTNDFASWNSIGVDYTFKKKLKLGLEYHMRFKENASVMDANFTEISLDYKLFKKFHVGGAVRFIDENDNQGKKQGIRDKLRFQFDVAYNYKLKRFSFVHRLRYQNKNEFGVSVLEGDIPTEIFRFKSGVNYNIKKWPLDPEFSAEIFNRGGGNEPREFSKYRLTFGTTYNLKKFGKFGINYRYEKGLIVGSFPENLNVFELKYRYSIN